MKKILIFLCALCLLLPLLCACAQGNNTHTSSGETWCMGFGSAEIALPEGSGQPLYIAGYHAGREISGVLDLQRASAVWMDTGAGGVLLIGVDCVGL